MYGMLMLMLLLFVTMALSTPVVVERFLKMGNHKIETFFEVRINHRDSAVLWHRFHGKIRQMVCPQLLIVTQLHIKIYRQSICQFNRISKTCNNAIAYPSIYKQQGK